MVKKCSKCGNKIGFTETKRYLEFNEGERLLCEKCYEKYSKIVFSKKYQNEYQKKQDKFDYPIESEINQLFGVGKEMSKEEVELENELNKLEDKFGEGALYEVFMKLTFGKHKGEFDGLGELNKHKDTIFEQFGKKNRRSTYSNIY